MENRRKNGTFIVAGGNGEGDHLSQITCPTSIFVDQDDSVYVSDYNNHRVMKWVNTFVLWHVINTCHNIVIRSEVIVF
jgi:hypothetical protein